MKILYIGHYNEGSTSRMRGEYIKEIINPYLFNVINLDIPLQEENKIFRSIGWRFKVGPLIERINKFIDNSLNGNYSYDLVWIDKGVFIKPSILKKIRNYSDKLVHFTPDPAFTYHKSKLFYRAIPIYDYLITTKSFEIDSYKKLGAKNVLFCTQGYDKKVHKPYYSFEEKEGVVFIGHYEKDRENMLEMVLKSNIPIVLSGIGWRNFFLKHKSNSNLTYLGKGVFAEDYARTISKGRIALGFLSKIIPELHTTRTIEIPACCTVLATENNVEIKNIFDEEDVIFFSSSLDLASKIIKYYKDDIKLKNLSENGYNKIISGSFDYYSIVKKLLLEVGIDLPILK